MSESLRPSFEEAAPESATLESATLESATLEDMALESAAEATVAFDDLLSILQDVWASYLHAGDELMPIPAEGADVQVSASVSVTGGWHGHVVLRTSDALAKTIASTLLDLPEAEVSDDDVQDALGEMVNVIGGSIKSLLPGPSALSLPIVVTANKGSGMRWPGAVEILSADLTWRGEAIAVTIWTASGAAHPAHDTAQGRTS